MAFSPAFPQVSEPPARLKLATPGEVLAAVPYLIGFAPQRSIVVLCLRNRQIGLSMRLDLGLPQADTHKIIVERVLADGADTALIVIFDPPAGSPRPGSSMARNLIRALKRADIHVQDALGVGHGRFWSYVCRERTCCPPEGRLLPEPGAGDHNKVAATFVSIGSAPLGSREEVSATLQQVSGDRRIEMVRCLDLEVSRPSANPIAHWRNLVSRYCESPPRPGSSLTPPEAARLIAAMGNPKVRDEVISWTSGGAVVGVLAATRELAPLALPPFDTEVLSALAWAAYSFGDGALASMALERALDADSKHNLSRLLMSALEGGIAPDQLREITLQLSTELGPDEFASGSGRWTPDER